VLGVGHNDRAVREFDLIARPAQHNRGRGHHQRWQPVGIEQLITNGDVTHRRPAGRRGKRGVQCERLTYTRARRDDDHLSRMQSVGHLVEFGEARGHAARDAAAGGDGIDLVHRRLQQILKRNEVFGKPAIGDVVDFRLRAVDHLGHVGALGTGVPVLHHPRASLHQPTQQRLLGHDARVVTRVRSCRHRRNQGVQVRRATDPAQHPPAVKFGCDRHRVGRLPPPV
jgi:hypothetical protein